MVVVSVVGIKSKCSPAGSSVNHMHHTKKDGKKDKRAPSFDEPE